MARPTYESLAASVARPSHEFGRLADRNVTQLKGRSTRLQQTAAMHYVYLIESAANERVRYTGFTDDLKQRIRDHNAGKNVSTAGKRPWRLVTYLAFSAKGQALTFERYLKSGSGHAFANKRLW